VIVGQFVIVVLSLLVLAAHFLRTGNLLIVAGVLVITGLLFVRKPWAARAAQVTLGVGVIEWVWTLGVYASERAREGEPYVRLVVILGSVAAVTTLAALSFESRRMRAVYRMDEEDAGEGPASA